MSRYRVSLGDLDKRDPSRKLKTLQELSDGPKTAINLSALWNIDETTSYRLLARLYKQGLVDCEDGRSSFRGTYHITQKGMEKLHFLEDQKALAAEVKKGLGSGVSVIPKGKLIRGPVALMRVREIASPSEIKVSLDQLLVEMKFDGWLVQVAGGRIYTRRGIEITENLPHLAKAVGSWHQEHVIGELVYWTPDGKMDESTVTRIANVEDPRIAAKRLLELPGSFQIILFDLLAHEGEDITDQPLKKRRLALEKLLKGTKAGRALDLSIVYPFKSWKQVFDAALKIGGEGVVFKNLDSPYFYRELGEREPSPANTWWKLKASQTDDFIVWNVSFSEKEKLMLHFGQFWQGKIVKVGEVNNLSRDMEEALVKLLLDGPFVVELEFQERFPGYPGALRNPRFKRLRPDKPMESVQLPKEHAI